jgi:sugar phosphate isomerase/epimerase
MNQKIREGDKALPELKGSFPFRLSSTSYILPAPILPNVRFLGPYLDEVELVLFESHGEENLPSREDLRELHRLGREMDLTYNVHLPTDVFLGDPDPIVRRKGCSTLARYYHATRCLEPTAYILHLDRRGADGEVIPDRESFLPFFQESLEELANLDIDPGPVAVENLDYPLQWIAPLVESAGMSLCLDLGHLLFYGFEVEQYLREYLERTSMIHLHGVLNGRDHRGADAVPAEAWESILRFLGRYSGGVSLEVFSLEDLRASMARLEDRIG